MRRKIEDSAMHNEDKPSFWDNDKIHFSFSNSIHTSAGVLGLTVLYKRSGIYSPSAEASTQGLIDWLFPVFRPAQEFFTYKETSPLTVTGCKI
jgi:hypothetical protein